MLALIFAPSSPVWDQYPRCSPLTHAHYDHIGGLDELRIYYLLQRTPLPVILSEPTYVELKRRYDYLFREKDPNASLTAQFDFHVLKELRGEIEFLDFKIAYLSFEQAGMPVLGFSLWFPCVYFRYPKVSNEYF